MKEIRNIIKAHEQAEKEGKKTALATVVHVEGSSYRRPGARMLVTEEGQLTGAISGGCLEGDALRKALLAITQQQNKLVTYDTTDEDDAKFGVQLGCNGIVHILFEPVQTGKPYNPVYLLSQLMSNRQSAVLVTLFSLTHTLQPGTSLLYRDGNVQSGLPDGLQNSITGNVQEAMHHQSSSLQGYTHDQQQLNAFIEYIAPPVALVIAGAGNDIQPLVELTEMLGWHTTVVDGRPTHATVQRFPKADKILVAKPEEVLPQLQTDNRTVFLLMTHNYNYDLALLTQLIMQDCAYIGILGPRKKLDRMLGELNGLGVTLTEKQRSVIYGPVGLDIGAETAEEIAVSVVAEIKAVMAARSGTSLKEKIIPFTAGFKNSSMNQTGIIILAAGNSSRLGRPKQLLSYQGRSFIQHVTAEALKAKLYPVFIITGANAEKVSVDLQHQDAEILYNVRWEEGMASGIVAGIENILSLHKGVEEVIISVCDQPFSSAALFQQLIEKRAASGKGIVACTYAGTIGTPVLFARSYFNSLLQLSGEEGAKKLLKLYEEDVETVPFPEGNIDIDSEDDYTNLLSNSSDDVLH